MPKKLNLLLPLLLLLAGVAAPPALAIGPGSGGSKIKIDDQRVGPYILLAATSPLPVTVGQMSVWVRVTGAEDDQLRREATVRVEARLRGGQATASAIGTHDNAGNDFDYVAHLPVDQAGQWDLVVTVEDELGQAEVTFTESVSRSLGMGLVLGLAVPFVILAGVVGVVLWRRSGATQG